MRNSKSGLFFCTRKCKDEAQRIGGLKEIMPSHYGTGQPYRAICWRHHKKECVVCGENKIVAVHHYDHNHNNNEPSNLIPLCPTHHVYAHSRYSDEVQGKIDEWRNNYLTSVS
jgi:5-methylcytosine-specific restriction endonuclease McrA